MPVIFFNGGYGDEQAVGGDTTNSFMRGYLVRNDKPLDLLFIGGHEVSDAPTYSETEGLMIPRRVNVNGRNIVREERLTSEVIKSVTLNLTLPSIAVSMTDRVFQKQNRCDYDVLFVPYNCDSGCNEWFLSGDDITLGTKRPSNGILGYDDNEAPIEWTRTMMITGNLIQYNGMEVSALPPATKALYSVLVLDETNEACDGCNCPYQTMYRGGGDGVVVGILEKSTDGGVTWSAVDTTAIDTDMGIGFGIYTDIVIQDGRILVAYSDVADGTGTDGGVAYIDDAGVAQVATFGTASTGIQRIIYANNRLWAFESAGGIHYSTDGGFNWTKLVQTDITANILAVGYDALQNVLFIGTATGGLHKYDFVTFTDLTAEIGSAGDITSVVVPRTDQVIVGDSLGATFENWNSSESDTFEQTAALGNSIGGIDTDGRNFRVFTGSGTTLFRRDATTLQKYEPFTTFTGNITGVYSPAPQAEEGEAYFAVVTDNAAGEMTLVRQCGLCFESA